MDTFVPRSLEELALEWPQDLDHISASSLKMAVRCPEQWRQRYVLGKRTPPNPELINGTANHAAIEHSMVQKIDTHEDLPVGDVLSFYEETFFERVQDAGGVGEIEIKDGSQQVYDRTEKNRRLNSIRKSGSNLVGIYHSTYSPYIQPLSVEKEFSIQLENLPVKLDGRIDLIATDAAEGIAVEMIDRKTTKRKKYKVEPEWNVQAEIYQLIEPLDHRWHISSYERGPLVQTEFVIRPRPPEIARLTLDHVIGEIGYFYRRYGPEQPWPARGKLHSWACGYCGYRPDCWAWRESDKTEAHRA